MADRAVLRTVCMASTVDRLLRKPYCESARPAGPSVWASRRPTMILSRILPAVSNIHSGRYDDGSAVGLPGFSIRTSLCRFQRAGKHPSLRHAVKTRRKLSKQASTAALRAVLGIPSGPGAAPILTRRYAHRSSSTPTSGIRCSSSTGGALISRGMTDGNSVDTARRTKSGAVGGDVLGALRRDMTVLYGLPHTSRSASSQSCLQQRRLLAFIALRSRLRASPCAHPCHTDGNICCDLDLGIGLPGAPAPSAAFAASWASRVTTAVWVPAKALRRDLTASGPKLAASRWVRRASQTSSFVVTSSRSLISIAVTAERVVATPSSPMASFNLWPSSPGLAHALVSCSSRSPFVLRRTLLTLPTESCSDGSDRRSFRISEYDFGSFAFTTTTSGRGRLCAFTLGFGSGALAIGVAFFLPFFFFFLWTCCQSSSTGLEAFAASFWSLVIVLRVGVGGLLPLLPGARDARNSPFARRPGDVCTAFSIVFGQGRCSSPSSAVRQLKCIFAAFVSICFRILWMLFLGSANSIISLILSPSRSRCSSGLNVLSVLSDSTSDWISDIDADVAPDPIFLCLRPSPPSIALSCSCRRSVVSSTCELVFGFTLICYSSSSSRSPKSVTAGSQCVRVPRASAGEHRAHSVLPPTRTSLRLYLLCWCAFVPC
uniref:Uncharacterized protein n=1 Tax=Trichogramma kaykai TaxID=54128 RepID=A0ABD2X773_9HYME